MSGVVVTVEAFLDAQYGYDVRAELVCESGTVSLAPNPPVARRYAGTDGFAVEADWRARFADAYRDQLSGWVAAIESGAPAWLERHWDGYAASADRCGRIGRARFGPQDGRWDGGKACVFYAG